MLSPPPNLHFLSRLYLQFWLLLCRGSSDINWAPTTILLLRTTCYVIMDGWLDTPTRMWCVIGQWPVYAGCCTDITGVMGVARESEYQRKCRLLMKNTSMPLEPILGTRPLSSALSQSHIHCVAQFLMTPSHRHIYILIQGVMPVLQIMN